MYRETTTGIGELSQLKDRSVKEATTGVMELLERGQAGLQEYQYLGVCGELHGVPIVNSRGFGQERKTCLQRECTRTFSASGPGAER